MNKIGTAGIAAVLCAVTAQAHALALVAVGDNFFATVSSHPGQGTNSLTIEPGETVEWRWIGRRGHTVTSETIVNGEPLFASRVLQQGGVFRYTFDTVGAYPYFCQVHHPQRGMVIVQNSVPEPGIWAFGLAAACGMLTPLRRRVFRAA